MPKEGPEDRRDFIIPMFGRETDTREDKFLPIRQETTACYSKTCPLRCSFRAGHSE